MEHKQEWRVCFGPGLQIWSCTCMYLFNLSWGLGLGHGMEQEERGGGGGGLQMYLDRFNTNSSSG